MKRKSILNCKILLNFDIFVAFTNKLKFQQQQKQNRIYKLDEVHLSLPVQAKDFKLKDLVLNANHEAAASELYELLNNEEIGSLYAKFYVRFLSCDLK